MLRNNDSPYKSKCRDEVHIERKFGYDVIDNLNYNEAVLDIINVFDFNKQGGMAILIPILTKIQKSTLMLEHYKLN